LRLLYIAVAISCCCLPAGTASAEAEDARAQRSADLTRAYLHTWSTNARVALADVPRLYAPRVSFYGRVLDHRALLREKAQFVRRWPARHYSLRPGTIRVACDGPSQRCVVRSVVDWQAESPVRKASARGSSTFEQGVDFVSSRPLVFRETGSVISHRKTRARG
jgi:hypothetical protein